MRVCLYMPVSVCVSWVRGCCVEAWLLAWCARARRGKTVRLYVGGLKAQVVEAKKELGESVDGGED